MTESQTSTRFTPGNRPGDAPLLEVKDLQVEFRTKAGVAKAIKDIDIDDNSFKPIEAIIRAMTLEERENPDVSNGSRKTRIANGSGTSIQQVNQLLKQFGDMRKLMKTMNKMGGGKRALSSLNPFGR